MPNSAIIPQAVKWLGGIIVLFWVFLYIATEGAASAPLLFFGAVLFFTGMFAMRKATRRSEWDRQMQEYVDGLRDEPPTS